MKIRYRLVTLLVLGAMGCATVTNPDLPPPENACDARCSSLWSFVYDKDFSIHQGLDLGVDAQGDVVFATAGSGALDLGDGPLEAPLQIAKLDPAGALLWQNGYDAAPYSVTMAVSPGGDVAFTGATRLDAMSFGGDTLSQAFPDHEETVIAVLDGEGNHVWSRRIATNEADTFVDPMKIAISPEGDVIVALGFTGSLAIDGTTLTAVSAFLSYDTALLRFDPGGHLVWANHIRAVGDTGLPAVASIVVTPSGDVGFAGAIYGAATGEFGLWTSVGQSDAFIGLIAGDTGEMRWAKLFGGSGADAVGRLSVAPDGALIATGARSNDADVAGEELDEEGSNAPFLAIFEPSGELRRARSLTSVIPKGTGARFMGRDPNGDLVIVVSHDDFTQGFDVIRLDPTGESELHRSVFPALSPDGEGMLIPNGFALDPLGNAIFTGVMRGAADFGTGVLEAEPWSDALFVAKVTP